MNYRYQTWVSWMVGVYSVKFLIGNCHRCIGIELWIGVSRSEGEGKGLPGTAADGCRRPSRKNLSQMDSTGRIVNKGTRNNKQITRGGGVNVYHRYFCCSRRGYLSSLF